MSIPPEETAPPRKRKPRPTNGVIIARTQILIGFILRGYSFANIKEWAEQEAKKSDDAQMMWGMADDTLKDAIEKAYKEIMIAYKSLIADSVDQTRAVAVRRAEYLYNQCVKIQDYKTALNVLRELNLLEGNYAAQSGDVKENSKLAMTLAQWRNEAEKALNQANDTMSHYQAIHDDLVQSA